MDKTFRDILKQRHDFASWKNTTTLSKDLQLKHFSFTGREFPEWRLLRADRRENETRIFHQSIWKRSEDELLSVNVLECGSRADAHEAIIDFLGEFESPLIARQTVRGTGDVAFAMPEETAVLFARANLVVLMRNAGPKIMELGTLARDFDDSLIRAEE